MKKPKECKRQHFENYWLAYYPYRLAANSKHEYLIFWQQQPDETLI